MYVNTEYKNIWMNFIFFCFNINVFIAFETLLFSKKSLLCLRALTKVIEPNKTFFSVHYVHILNLFLSISTKILWLFKKRTNLELLDKVNIHSNQIIANIFSLKQKHGFFSFSFYFPTKCLERIFSI